MVEDWVVSHLGGGLLLSLGSGLLGLSLLLGGPLSSLGLLSGALLGVGSGGRGAVAQVDIEIKV